MKFDINETIADMSSTIRENVEDNWEMVKNTSSRFLENRKERLELLAELRLSGDLSQDKFDSRLSDEKLILEAELHAIAVISKAIAQKAANAALEVLAEAVKKVISTIL